MTFSKFNNITLLPEKVKIKNIQKHKNHTHLISTFRKIINFIAVIRVKQLLKCNIRSKYFLVKVEGTTIIIKNCCKMKTNETKGKIKLF